VQNDRDVPMQGLSVYGTINLRDQGYQKIRTGTHRFGMFRHPTFFLMCTQGFLWAEDQQIQEVKNIIYFFWS